MNEVLALHKDGVDVVVKSDLGYQELNQLLASQGLSPHQIQDQVLRLEA